MSNVSRETLLFLLRNIVTVILIVNNFFILKIFFNMLLNT